MPLSFVPQKADPQLKALGIHSDEYRLDYVKVSKELLSYVDANSIEGDAAYTKVVRTLASKDFFFLCYFVLDLPVNHPFLVARINEIQDKCHNTIDLWLREGWKSTLLTFAMPIFEIINNREERIGIFSHTRDMAKSHMRKIKLELQTNKILWAAFPDIFYENPDRKAPKWSENEGLYVKRNGSYGEATVEAWGLIEKLPAGKHFSIRIYDDIVTETAISTAQQMEKVESQFALSQPLGARVKNFNKGKRRVIGTRYGHKDLYGKLIDSRYWTPRIYPAEVDEKGEALVGGIPVYKTRDELKEMYDNMGEYLYGSQMLQNPTAEGMKKFRRSWLKEWNHKTIKPYMNFYIIVDPASTVSLTTDYTCMLVIGVDYLRNFWVMDIVRDRLELGKKWEILRDMVIKWAPLTVGYEKHAAGIPDIQYFEMKQEEEGVMFFIEPIASYANKVKIRIPKLMPLFEQGKIILPVSLMYNGEDMVTQFIEEEYLLFPFPKHDDILDAMSHLLTPEMKIVFPTAKGESGEQEYMDDPLDMGLNTYHDNYFRGY